MVPVVPDAPVGHFRLTLFGGAQGYISNTESLCAAPTVTTVQFNGQNGKSVTQQVKTKAACKAKKHVRHERSKKAPSQAPQERIGAALDAALYRRWR